MASFLEHHELGIEFLGADDIINVVSAAFDGIIGHVNRYTSRSVNSNILFIELFDLKLVERNAANSGVGLVTLEGSVGDEGGDVLFQLSEVLDDVVLCEDNSVLIVHLLGYAEEELALLEHVYHCGHVSLDLGEHLFGVISVVEATK